MDATGRTASTAGDALEAQVARDAQDAAEVDEVLLEFAAFLPDEDTDLPVTPVAAEEAAMHVYRDVPGEPADLGELVEDAELAAAEQVADAVEREPQVDHEPDLVELVDAHEQFLTGG